MGRKSRAKQERKFMSFIDNEAEKFYLTICQKFAEIPYEDREWAFYDIMDEIIEQGEAFMERGETMELLLNISMQQALMQFGEQQGYFDEED